MTVLTLIFMAISGNNHFAMTVLTLIFMAISKKIILP